MVPLLSASPKMVYEYIKAEEIYYIFTINLCFYTIMMVIQVYFSTRQTYDTAGFQKEKEFFRTMKNIGMFKNNEPLKPIDKFKNAFRKFISYKRSAKISKKVNKSDTDNSLKRKFLGFLVFWVFVSLMFYVFINECNKDQNRGKVDG